MHTPNADNALSFNINGYIKVKLLEKGYELMAKDHNRYLDSIPKWQMRDANYYKNKADSNGYTSFQAWAFIELFGPVTRAE